MKIKTKADGFSLEISDKEMAMLQAFFFYMREDETLTPEAEKLAMKMYEQFESYFHFVKNFEKQKEISEYI